MAEEEQETFLQKLLFYTTAFFILLGIFSLFAFLFLVPFVIDPAFTTIFMDFDTRPALCVTIDVESRRGTKNCSWTSCREGCTKELYDCTQIRVNYKRAINGTDENASVDEEGTEDGGVEGDEIRNRPRYERSSSSRDYNYIGDELDEIDNDSDLPKPFPTGLMKFCVLVVYMNLVYALAIPIPSFIISVIYLTVAYFKIYNEEEEVLVEKDGDEIGDDEDVDIDDGVDNDDDDDEDDYGGGDDGDGSNATPLPPTSGGVTPGSDAFREDLASFGHQLKVAMADEASRESLDGLPNSISTHGNLSKTMTTSISTPPGPTAAV
ncbi:hypothetical protein HCN44_011343 [Aphidius gifuensis]|uniref:Protein tipE n=1 Tax=Aphidius gifuensis TaxID=684658 RepID=A0A834XZJ1_APHGI|nr:hypothetical protein HCN44_011343 [Aphidius gifuensis]